MIVELAQELGLNPKRTSAIQYNSACPACGTGRDRFCLWPKEGNCGRFWCRQCGVYGDAIDFCRSFLGLDYRSACRNLQVDGLPKYGYPTREKHHFKAAQEPSSKWQEQARIFALKCHNDLLHSPLALEVVKDRGLSLNTIKHFQIGWNSSNQFMEREGWGLSFELSDQGVPKKLWLPEGLLIPTFSGEKIIKLKIRRRAWHEQDKLPKYVEILGSMKSPSWYGYSPEKPILLLEAELDAILIQELAGDLCSCMAIGGAGKHPDLESDQMLKKAPLLLFAFDFDEGGQKAYPFWKFTYPQIKPWPTPQEKGPADAYRKGVDLREWIEAGITNSNKT